MTSKPFYAEAEEKRKFPEKAIHGYWKCTCCGITGAHCEECGKEHDQAEFMNSPLGRSLCKDHRAAVEGNVYAGNN